MRFDVGPDCTVAESFFRRRSMSGYRSLMGPDDLTLFEGLLLLGLAESTGKPVTSTLNFGLGGAILADLSALGRVDVKQEGKKFFVEVLNPAPTGLALLDEALERITRSKRRRQAQSWVGTIASTKALTPRSAERLVEAGILEHREKRVLIFRTNRFPESNPLPEQSLRASISGAMAGGPHSPKHATLIGLAFGCGAMKATGDRQQKRATRERVAQLTAGDPFGDAVRKAAEAHMAATTTAATVT